MKPIISETVFRKLRDLLQKAKSPGGKQLGQEISKAEIVKDKDLQKNVVTLNSVVEFTDEDLDQPITLKLVMPEEADLARRMISICAPISIALIGFRESYSFNWMLPSGLKKLKIIKVIN
jgi:regulator of nucleoside diphosphate kinase